MTPTVRLVSAVVVGLLSAGSAVAQPETAPPPRFALAEVAKEYLRLGLPLPPPGAPLVRIDSRRFNFGFVVYDIGFRLPPRGPGKDPRYLIGYGFNLGYGSTLNQWIDPSRVEVVEPKPDALHDVWMLGDEWLCFAAQCQLRGWHDLARAAYTRAGDSTWVVQFTGEEGAPDPIYIVELRFRSYFMWADRLDRPGTDRKEVVARLRERFAEEPVFQAVWSEDYFLQIERTVAPRKPKPGTVEALIDDLTEYWRDEFDPSNRVGQEAYWKLAELGFDAVPALLAHLDDDRISRAHAGGGIKVQPHRLTVGLLCGRLLHDLSARTIHDDLLLERYGTPLDPEKAREWFAAAQKVGEEKWLLDHAIPKEKSDSRAIIRAIGAKYPQRLPEIYRAMLKKKSSPWNNAFVPEILASKLTREQKLALFEEGAVHDDLGHLTAALEGLAALDQGLLRKHLLKTLKEAPARAAMGKGALPDSLDPLLTRADDPACWDALATVAKQVPPGSREYIIREFSRPLCAPDDDDPIRRERLCLLVPFLDDRSIDPDAKDDSKGVEVRDFAATHLAGLLKFPVERLSWHPWYSVQHDRDRGPFARLFFREAVRLAALRELAVKG